jgi:hypothetical protein
VRRLSLSEDERVPLVFLSLSSHTSLYSPIPPLPPSCILREPSDSRYSLFLSLSLIVILTLNNVKYLKSLSQNNSNKSMVYSVYAIQDTFRTVGWEGIRHKV